MLIYILKLIYIGALAGVRFQAENKAERGNAVGKNHMETGNDAISTAAGNGIMRNDG